MEADQKIPLLYNESDKYLRVPEAQKPRQKRLGMYIIEKRLLGIRCKVSNSAEE